MTRDLRPAWRVVALLGIAWWLADRWLLAPAPPLVWSLGRDALWGLPVQGLILAAAALLLARGRSAAFALVPALLLVVATLAPAPGVTRAPLALLRYTAALGAGTPSGILAGLSGLLLLLAATAATAAAITGRLQRSAGAVLLGLAVAPPLLQLLLHAFGVAPVAAGRLTWSLVASCVGFGLVWWSLPRLVADGVMSRPGRLEGRLLAGLLPAGVLLAYVAVKLEAAGLSAGDENIYFYDVLLFTRGILPYRDFFFAHPPLHVVIPGLLCMVTGFSLTVLKLVPLAASCVTGLAVWDTVRRPFGQVGAAAGLVGWLFALEQLQASSNLTGVNLTVLFMALSLWCVVRHRPLAGGLLAGAAVTTGVYAAPLLAAVPLVLAFRDPKGLVRFLAGALGVALAVNLGFRALAGPDYWNQVYLFHTLKPVHSEQTQAGWLALRGVDWAWLGALWALVLAGGALRGPLGARIARLGLGRSALAALAVAAGALALLVVHRAAQAADPTGPARVLRDLTVLLDGKEFQRTGYYHAGLLLGAVLMPLAWAAGRMARLRGLAGSGTWAPAALFTLLFTASLAELSVLRETYSFYYLVLLLPAALATGALAGLAWSGLTAGGWVRPLGAAVLLWLACLGPVLALDIGKERFPEESKGAGQVKCYPWKESFPDNPLGGQVRARLWRHCRIQGSLEDPVPRYLWNKKHHFNEAHEVAAYIKANSAEGETLAGASMTTPLLAILSGRDVAAGFVDTNRKRFSAGLVTEEDFWAAVCRTPVRYIVTSPRSMFTPRRMSRHPVIRRYFKPDKLFDIPALKFSGRYPLVLFRRVADSPEDDGTWCRWPDGRKQ
jgi:hypothetical protein